MFTLVFVFGVINLSLSKHIYSQSQLAEIVQLRAKAANFFGSLIKDCESIILTGNPAESLR